MATVHEQWTGGTQPFCEWFLFSKRKTLLHFTLSKFSSAGYLQALFPFHFSFLWSSPRDLFWSSPWGLFEEKLIKFSSNAVSPSHALLGLGERQLKHVILRHTIPFSWLLAIRYKNCKLIISLAWFYTTLQFALPSFLTFNTFFIFSARTSCSTFDWSIRLPVCKSFFSSFSFFSSYCPVTR